MAIVFDNAASAKGTAPTLSFNFTIGGGASRLLVIGVSVLNGEVGAVHYNTAPAFFVGVQVEGNLRVYLYYAFDINLPRPAGTYLLQVFGSSGLTEVQATAISVSGAKPAPEVWAQKGVSSSASISTNISPATAGAMAFDVVGTLSGSVSTLTPSAGQTKREQQDSTGSDVASSTRLFATPTSSSLGWTFNTPATRAAHIIGVWAPETGVVDPPVDPGPRDIRTTLTTIVSPGTTGNVSVTGIGFKGKAALFWGVPVQDTAVAVDAAQWLGIVDNASPTIQQRCVSITGRNGTATTRSDKDEQRAISIVKADNPSPVVVASVESWNEDGLVLKFVTTAPGYLIFAMILGGADLRSWVGQADFSAGSVSGLPFSPDLGLVLSRNATSVTAGNVNALQSLGAFDRNLNQWWVGAFQGITDTVAKGSILRTTGFGGQLYRSGSTPAITYEASVTSVSASGFAWSGSDPDTFYYLVLNFNGARAQVGSFAKSTAAAPAVQSLPDPGWKPQAYLLASAVKNAQAVSGAAGCSVAFGAMAGTRQRSTLRTDVDAAMNADQRAFDQRILGLGSADADATSLGRALAISSNTPSIEWNPNTNQARLIGFVLLETGIWDPDVVEDPARLVSATSLPTGTSLTRVSEENVVIELRQPLNLSGYQLEHFVVPSQGESGGWQLYYRFNEAAALSAGTLIEVHSGRASDDPDPAPGRVHRYTKSSGQAPTFDLNTAGDVLRLVRPDGFEVKRLSITISNNPGDDWYVVRGVVQNLDGALLPDVLVRACALNWGSLGIHEAPLGTTLTGDEGTYEISYKPVPAGDILDPACAPPAGLVNLVVKVLEGTLDNPGQEMVRSPSHYPAERVEVVNLQVDRPVSKPGVSEYRRIDRQFRKCLTAIEANIRIILISIRDNPNYLDFAAKATGIEPELLLAYARANLIAYAINSAIPWGTGAYTGFENFRADVVFALVRAQLGTSLEELLPVEPSAFLRIITLSIHHGTVDAELEERLRPGAAQHLPTQWSLVRAYFLSTGTFVTDASRLLKLVLVTTERTLTVATLQSQYRGSFAAFVAALRASEVVTDTEARHLLFVFDVYAIAGRHFPIVDVLYTKIKNASASWTSAPDLSAVPRSGTGSWTEFALLQVTKGGFPRDIYGRTDDEKAAAHARQLFEAFAKEFPQGGFVRDAVVAATASTDQAFKDAAAFLLQTPQFNLEETHIERYMLVNKPILNGAPLSVAAVAKLKQLQRLRRLTPQFQSAQALIGAGLDSSVAIARLDEEQFVVTHEAALGGITKAQEIHRTAKRYAGEVLNQLVRFQEDLNNTGGAIALAGPVDYESALTESFGKEPRYARYATLFGNLFSCASRHCETVLSPAAYLVDLLEFLNGAPKDLLLMRRPDLAEIELSCENTDQVEPYIDLVIELLSAVIAPWRVFLADGSDKVSADELNAAADATDPGHVAALAKIVQILRAARFEISDQARVRVLPLDAPGAAPSWALEDDGSRWRITGILNPVADFVAAGAPQTSARATFLDVFPAHTNPVAEDVLGAAVFPLDVPLALGRREVELVLHQQGLSRSRVLSALAKDPTSIDPETLIADPAAARAYLSLTENEERALRCSDPPVAQYWGFTGVGLERVRRPDQPHIELEGSWRDLLSVVAVFLHRAQLTYSQLLDLLATEYIHDAGQLIIVVSDKDPQTGDYKDARECNYNHFRLTTTAGATDAPSETAFRRISFFLRIWRKLGWDMYTLDRYLMRVERQSSPRTPPPDVVRVAQVAQLAERLSLTPLAVFSFFADLDLREQERLGVSQFERQLFSGPRSTLGNLLLERVLEAGPSATITIDTPEQRESLEATLAKALGLNPADLTALWELTGMSNTVSVPLLSELARLATLTRALQLSPAAYFRAKAVLDVDAFAGSSFNAILTSLTRAVKELTALARTGLSIELLAYLLGDPRSSQLIPPESAIKAICQQLVELGRSLGQLYPPIAASDTEALPKLLDRVLPAENSSQGPRILELIVKTTLSPAERVTLERLFKTFRGDSAAQLVNDTLGKPVGERALFLANALRTDLIERDRRDRVLAIAAGALGVARESTDYLLTGALSSVVAASQPAVVDWENGIDAARVNFDDLIPGGAGGQWSSYWVGEAEASVTFMATVQAPGADVTLSLDGRFPLPSVVTGNATSTTFTFAPVTVQAGQVFRFELVSTNPGKLSLRAGVDGAVPSTPPSAWFSEFKREAYVRLQKAALLVSGLKLTAVELRALVLEDAAAPASDRILDGLPTAQVPNTTVWPLLRAYAGRLELHRRLPLSEGSLFEALNGDTALDEAEVARLTGWKAADVTTALSELWTAPPLLENADTWAILERAIAIATRLDLSLARTLELLVGAEPTSATARALLERQRGKLSDAAFSAAYKPPRDQLRRAHRDALVGWLTTRPLVIGDDERHFFNANDLFGFFLIDVEMEPETQISRIVLAHNSIQLFVQRMQLGLENAGVLATLNSKGAQWQWMGSYRVWEANRKVFLYPENWIEPQLRDDKSDLFRELEQELLQDDVDAEAAQTILGRYIERLYELSRLVVVGAHRAPDDTTYLVARDRTQPYSFYYRTLRKAPRGGVGHFSTWTKIDLEIEADFVVPVLVGTSLHIFWPMVLGKEKVTTGTEPGDLGSVAVIRLRWSSRDPSTGKWSKPRLGKGKVVDGAPVTVFDRKLEQDGPDTSLYHLRVREEPGARIRIQVIKTTEPTQRVAYAINTGGDGGGGGGGDWEPSNSGNKGTHGTTGHEPATGTAKPTYSVKILGDIVISAEGEETVNPNGTELALGSLYPASTLLRNNAAYQTDIELPGQIRRDSLMLGRTSYFGRVPAEEGFRVVVSDAGYFQNPQLGPFVFEAGAALFLGDFQGQVQVSGIDSIAAERVRFETFGHPVMPDIVTLYRGRGPTGIMNRLTQALPASTARYYNGQTYYGGIYLGYHIAGDAQAWGTMERDFRLDYWPASATVKFAYPLPTVEFAYGTSFGAYNWELFFHLPMLVADRLSQQLRFGEALEWIHYVFDPRQDLNSYEASKSWVATLPAGARFWNFLPFFANRDVTDSLFDIMGFNEQVHDTTRDESLHKVIEDWRNNPFSPHLIARQRIAAYQKFTVMKYLDVLVAWGDDLFRRDSFESINQATQLYVLAAELLGQRPEVIESTQPQLRLSYRDFEGRGLGEFSNALVELESFSVGSSLLVSQQSLPAPHPGIAPLERTAVSSLFFRIPRNEKLEGYWDTVADRLFKIRNSLNIDGVKRALALFQPPIDPALLVRARAAGIDLSQALNQLSQPLPHYRFSVWAAQAKELASELKSFGAALLAALEKRDAEALALLRQDHELRLLSKVTAVRKQQLAEAEQNLVALQARRKLPEDRIQDLSRREFMNASERSSQSLTKTARGFDIAAGAMNTLGGAVAGIPQLTIAFVGAEAQYGGLHLSQIFNALGTALSTTSSVLRTDASLAATLASYERRQEDWTLQIRQAKLELKDIDAQIVAAEIRIEIATKELENHELQIEQSEAVRVFLEDKFTSQDLYQWMVTQLSTTYQRVYSLAYDAAKTAERAFGFELGVEAPQFIQSEYRDSLKKGLLAGEKLFFDLKRMEVAYLQQDKRELEITKAISLESLNPEAVEDLRRTGECDFELPEILFDLDFPGHYFRRIRAVRLTIPAVTGPYTSISAKLSLLSSAVRIKDTADPDKYPYTGLDDARFTHDTRGVQSIATSRAQDDAGLFELNFRDERYLPFERAGVVSRWKLVLPPSPRQFDYGSISDVVIQLSYTAREGGGSLSEGATKTIKDKLNNILKMIAKDPGAGLVQVLSLKREFPDALHQLLTTGDSTITLRPEHFPYVLRDLDATLKPVATGQIGVIAEASGGANLASGGTNLTLSFGSSLETTTFTQATPLRFFTGTVGRGSSGLLAGGQEEWRLTSNGLSLEKVEDIIFVLKYEVT